MPDKKTKPDCYACKHSRPVPGDAHKSCAHPDPQNVTGNETGIRRGWFNHPWNFDPTWIETCDSFEERE